MAQYGNDEWIPITMETTLYPGDILRNVDSLGGKEEVIFWRVLPSDHSPFPGIVPIKSFMHSGRAVSGNECRERGLAFDLFVRNNYFLLIDKSYSSIFWPTSLSDAVFILNAKLAQEEKDKIRDYKEEDLVEEHFGIGQWIRNTFGLHIGNTELMLDCDSDNPEADHVSGIIIKEFWKSLQDN